MMNNIFRKVSLFTVVLSSCLMMQSCLEEELPKDYATGSQVQGSETAQQGLLTGLSAYMVKSGVYGNGSAYDNGYPSQMIIRDVMTADMPVYNADYDYFSSIENGKGLRSPFNYTYFYYYGLVNNANSIISSLDVEGASESAKASAGVAYAYRALAYLDMARMFEFKKTGFSDFDAKAAKVMGLTVPIVTEKTTAVEGKNNPRVPYYTMYRFILHDLNKAEAYLKGYKRTGKEQPDESVVDGLKARFWLELGSRFYDSADDLTAQLAHENDADGYDALGITAVNDCFAKAASYAQAAIDNSGCQPMSQSEWYNKKTGFNTANSSWIWKASLGTKEQLGSWYHSWMGTVSSESTAFSMGGYGKAYRMIGALLYNQIPDADWRKKTWVAPEDAGKAEVPAGYSTLLDGAGWAKLPAYTNLKYHPGSGNLSDLYVGCLCDIPLMRVEEMYLIYIEAIAHTEGVDAAKTVLNDFMNAYRYTDGSYKCQATDIESLEDAVLLQKRIELWGEGLLYFDYKRLKKTVVRTYTGTNFLESHRLNSKYGFVAPWMDCYIPEYEKSSNPAVVLNPDPTSVVEAKSE